MADLLTLPFAASNLRRNPFGSLPPEEIPFVPLVPIEPLLERLADRRFALQFVGECGRGKTTHIQAIHALLPGAPYVHLPEGQRPPPIPHGPIVCVDESQRLGRLSRRRLFRRDAALVLGTHVDHTPELLRTGRLVETVSIEGLSLDRLDRIVRARIEAARRGPGPVPRIGRATLERLLERHGDDLRSITDQLYDRMQPLREADVEV